MNKADKIIEEIESMPIEIKTQIIEKLLEGIYPPDKEIDKLWVAEAESRVNELETGYLETIPGEAVFKEIKEKYIK